MRLACKKSSAEADYTKKVANITLRKEAPTPGYYAVSDLICFKRENTGARTPEEKWSSPTRIIGFDGPKVVWGLNETVPVCLAIDKIRPAMPDEALAHLYLHGHRMKDDFEVCPDDEQVRYVNEARPRSKRGFHPREQEDDDNVSEIDQAEGVARPSTGWQLHGRTWKRRAVEARADIPIPATEGSPESAGQRPFEISIEDAPDGIPEAVRVDRNRGRSRSRGRGEQDAIPDDHGSTPATNAVVENTRQQQRRGRSRSRGRDDDDDPVSLDAFLAERTAIDTRVKGNRRKQMQGKTLRYEYCDDKTRAGLDKSRAKEWKKWLDLEPT